MPRVIPALWFERLNFADQPFFNFWLVRLSIRQTAILFAFAGLAFLSSQLVAGIELPFLLITGPLFQIFVGATVFIVGCAVFMRRGRSFSPEWYLKYFILQTIRGGKAKKKNPSAKAKTKEGEPEVFESRPLYGNVDEVVRIVGTLLDPSAGKPLAGVPFEVEVDGKPYYSGVTEKDGTYSVIFSSPEPGVFNLSIKPRGHASEAERIQVQIGTRVVQAQEKTALPPAPVAQVEETGEEGQEKGAYVYELFPTNFITLQPERQDEAVNHFRQLLNSLEQEVKIHVINSSKKIEVKGTEIDAQYYRFFIESKEPIDYVLNQAGLTYQHLSNLPDQKIVRAYRKQAVLEGGRWVKAAAVYSLPATLIEGFISEFYGIVDKVVIGVKPLPQDVAVARAQCFSAQLSGMIYAEASKNRTPTEQVRRSAEMAQALAQALVAGQTRLFEVMINLAVGGKTSEELRANFKRLRSACAARLVRIDCPAFVQDRLYTGKLGKYLTCDTGTAGALYPFVSAEVIETPGGVFFGMNRLTGGPILYDPFLRGNLNIMILGQSGTGKSYATKMLLYRLAEKHPDLAFFIIDPENEYSRPAIKLDLSTDVVRVASDMPLGLDPLKLFANAKSVAADALIEMLNLTPQRNPELVSEIKAGVERSSSIFELYRNSSKELKKYLKGLLEGPESFLFEGNPCKFSNRAVFNLRELHKALRLSREERGALHLASLLIFGAIWNRIEQLPRHQPKLIIVDELWLYVVLPVSAAFLEQVSRRGRKRNVIFVLNSQRPADVLDSPAGRAALENCATKILLKQDETAVDLVAKTFGLTDAEKEAVTDYSPGEALLMSKGIRAQVKFLATPDEHATFTTKASEVAE